MVQDADPALHCEFVKALIRNDRECLTALQGRDTATHKLVNDPRVTRIGKFLRKTSLDELPQLWNVLKGDMSLVGPRPDVLYSVEEYSSWHQQRLAAQPGISGLWQVRGRSEIDFDDMVRIDIEYIENQSFFLDLQILLLTIPTVLTGHGAV
jgi:lipopolysaccharide/colanic/teichoic acid biosynthesis glycosyltransferase